ncbi:hypothetical protein GCM10025868_11530 [Angustibacter aerolatus]|uniref:IclR-ED domain-containing protein n=1 Tax=Angustibacter aerolatus TaxID=1162965 RepID=A0ABQ6JCL1_9ACTN|nr:hypothetical protein [Angustibacter aerolatus]GMA85903.1 hypothetical protein GCM10025868_11530 [Angustibacter aerolatus]
MAAGWVAGPLAASVGVVSLSPLDVAAVGPAVRDAAGAVAARLTR